MAITNGYCSLAEIKAALRISDNTDNALLEQAVEAASRRIDGYCGRFFYQQARTLSFYSKFEYLLSTPDLALSALTLRTDEQGDGSFSTTWTADTDYILQPEDAPFQGRPWTQILAVGSRTFILPQTPQRPTVRIIGTFGWPAVPDDVREAAILLSSRGFARYNSALGVVGFGEMALQVRSVDPDVRDLLQPYRILTVA